MHRLGPRARNAYNGKVSGRLRHGRDAKYRVVSRKGGLGDKKSNQKEGGGISWAGGGKMKNPDQGTESSALKMHCVMAVQSWGGKWKMEKKKG